MDGLKKILTCLILSILTGNYLNAMSPAGEVYYDNLDIDKTEGYKRNLKDEYLAHIRNGLTVERAITKAERDLTMPSFDEMRYRQVFYDLIPYFIEEILKTDENAIDAVNVQLDKFRGHYGDLLGDGMAPNKALLYIQMNLLPENTLNKGKYFIERRAFKLLLEELEIEMVYGPSDDADLGDELAPAPQDLD
jgi:hypothetical protein